MSDKENTKLYKRPDYWLGDDASFNTAVKQAAIVIKTQISSPDNLVFAVWGTWLAHVILENQNRAKPQATRPVWWLLRTKGDAKLG